MNKTPEQIITIIRKNADEAIKNLAAAKERIARPGDWLVTGFEIDDLARWNAAANTYATAVQYLDDEEPVKSLDMLTRYATRRVFNSRRAGSDDGHGLLRTAENLMAIELLETLLDGKDL